MDKNDQLLTLAWVSNRGFHQTNFLFELCGQDFFKLMKLEAYLKKTQSFTCPNDVETVETMVRKWDRFLEEEKEKNKKK